MENDKNKPSYEKRLGNIRIAVWENNTNGKLWHNAIVTRRYKQGEDWKEAPTFNGLADLALVAECVQYGKAWIAQRQDESQ